MALTSARLVELYPEWSAVATADPAAVAAACAQATTATDAEVFGDLTEAAQAAYAAHVLAARPQGKEARLKATAGTGFETTYSAERKRLETLCCSTWIVP